jgi:hypothetical protein
MAPTDRVIIGPNPNDPTTTGVWVSKPGVNATAALAIPPGKVYGYQIEDFSELGTTFIDGSGGDYPGYFNLMASYYSSGAVKAGGTANKNLIFSGNYGHASVITKTFVDPPGQPWMVPQVPSSDAFIGSNYPIVEVRVRRTWGGGDPDPDGAGWDSTAPSNRPGLVMYYAAKAISGGVDSFTGWNGRYSHASSVNGVVHPDPTRWRSVFPVENEWKTLEFDMDIPGANYDGWVDLDEKYRIVLLRLDFYNNTTGSGWVPKDNPMWEIEYIRVKQRRTPINVGATASRIGEMLFDSDLSHMGLVHQAGTVTIGTAKALINGNTSNRVAGHVVDENANGYVSFPELPYIPLVLFQRIDENVGLTGSSYPGGEAEFSICTQDWEDHRYPTIDMNTSENILYKGFDIQTVSQVKSSAYFKGNLNAPPMHENFYSFTTGGGANELTGAGGWYLQRYNDQKGEDFPLPWTGEIPSTSKRVGRKFSDMVQSFSEVRTFAYARAKKDGFWLTCRNAIGQEGLEPILNLAPVLPEKGVQNHGNSAYTAMQFQTDNGAWGMFHPGLALYDGNIFTEGLKLKWDSTVTANSFLLDKIGKDYYGDTYPQYRWGPNFSCSGLPFSGALARPNDPAPTDKNKYPLAYKTINVEGKNAGWTANGMLREGTGGFYPYRYQSNEWYHDNDGSEHSTGIQYNIKRLSSAGIFHPHGVVPETSLAFDNKNTDFSDMVPGATANVGVYNQTAYIGGAKNKRFAATKVHTLEFRTDERWPDEPQKSYFSFAGAKGPQNYPSFDLSPPGVVPESIIYTTGSAPGQGEVAGELMIANIDGTNVRLLHDANLTDTGGADPYLVHTDTSAEAPNPGAAGGSGHHGVQWGPEKDLLMHSALTGGSSVNGIWSRRLDLTGPPGNEIFCTLSGAHNQITSENFPSHTPVFKEYSDFDTSPKLMFYGVQGAKHGLAYIDGDTQKGLNIDSNIRFVGESEFDTPGSHSIDDDAGFVVDNSTYIPFAAWGSSAAFVASRVATSGDATSNTWKFDDNPLPAPLSIWGFRTPIFADGSPPVVGRIAFSHDAKQIAFASGVVDNITGLLDGDIYIADFPSSDDLHAGVRCSNIRNLTNHGAAWSSGVTDGVSSGYPTFSNDDKKVFFQTKFTDKSSSSLNDWKLQYSDLYPEDVEYDSDFSKPPTYKYWVLRVPVSFPEYT